MESLFRKLSARLKKSSKYFINRPPLFFNICTILIFLIGMQNSSAQTIYMAKGDSIYKVYIFESVVVYGERYFRKPSMISGMDAEGIRMRNGTSAADILRTDAGLTVTSGSKGETEIRIRGFKARDVLVLMDGRPLNPGYYGKADLSMLPIDNIASVKIIKGPASVAYGANSMGGVINIITKNGFEKPATTLNAEFGYDQFRSMSVNHSRRIGSFNYWISGYENHSTGFRLSDFFNPVLSQPGGIRKGSQYHKIGITAKLGFNHSENSSYGLTAAYHWARKGCAPSVSPLEQHRFREFPEWKRFGTSLNGRWQLSPAVELKAVAFVDAYHDRFKSYKSAEMTDDNLEYDSLLKNWTLGGSANAGIELSEKQHLLVGLHMRRDLINKKPDRDEEWYSHRNLTVSVFGENVYRVTPLTAVTLGLGFHLFQTENMDSQVKHFSPMLSIGQELPFHVYLNASWANAIRFPAMHHLYSTSSGNEELKPEEADKMEIGLERAFLWGGWQGNIEIACFYNNLKNMIYRASRTYHYENIREAVLRGWEVRMQWGIKSFFSAEINYARVNTAGSSPELMEEMPENRWGLRLSGRTGFGMEISYEYNFFGTRTTHLESVTLQDYQVHNFKIFQELVNGVKLKIRVSNFLDADYQEELGYPAPGRQISAGFTWDI